MVASTCKLQRSHLLFCAGGHVRAHILHQEPERATERSMSGLLRQRATRQSRTWHIPNDLPNKQNAAQYVRSHLWLLCSHRGRTAAEGWKIGRASCRERVCQYV